MGWAAMSYGFDNVGESNEGTKSKHSPRVENCGNDPWWIACINGGYIPPNIPCRSDAKSSFDGRWVRHCDANSTENRILVLGAAGTVLMRWAHFLAHVSFRFLASVAPSTWWSLHKTLIQLQQVNHNNGWAKSPELGPSRPRVGQGSERWQHVGAKHAENWERQHCFLLLGASFHLSALAQRPQNDETESKTSRFENALAPIKLRLSVSALAFPQGLREQRRQFLS